MGFSAMLADEYILIVPFAYHLHPGSDPDSPDSHRDRDYRNYRESAQQKAMAVVRNLTSASKIEAG